MLTTFATPVSANGRKDLAAARHLALYERIGYLVYARRVEDGYARVYPRKTLDGAAT